MRCPGISGVSGRGSQVEDMLNWFAFMDWPRHRRIDQPNALEARGRASTVEDLEREMPAPGQLPVASYFRAVPSQADSETTQ